MSDLNKNTHNQITEQDIKEHRSRGIYLRDDHCDWGSSELKKFQPRTAIIQKTHKSSFYQQLYRGK